MTDAIPIDGWQSHERPPGPRASRTASHGRAIGITEDPDGAAAERRTTEVEAT